MDTPIGVVIDSREYSETEYWLMKESYPPEGNAEGNWWKFDNGLWVWIKRFKAKGGK